MSEDRPAPDAAQRAELAQAFIEQLPHARALQMRVDEIGAGRAVISMPWAEHLVGDPHTGVIHGGVISALMDTCSGAAVMCHPSQPRSTATLDLRIDYMRSATPRPAHHRACRMLSHDPQRGLPARRRPGRGRRKPRGDRDRRLHDREVSHGRSQRTASPDQVPPRFGAEGACRPACPTCSGWACSSTAAATS